jgi:outer membrane protein TolC
MTIPASAHALALALACAFTTLLLSPPARAEGELDGRGKPLSLEALVELARKHNPGLAAGGRATAAVLAMQDEADRSWQPTGELLALVAPSPRIECQTDQPRPADFPGSAKEWRQEHCDRTNRYEASVDLRGVFTRTELRLTLPVYTFGKLSAGKEAAARGVQASRAREAGLASDLDFNVRRAFYGYQLARQSQETLDEGMEYLEKARKQVDAALKEGKEGASPTDRFRLTTVRANVEARLHEARRYRELAIGGMRALLGPSEPTTLAIEPVDLEPVVVAEHPLAYWEDRARAHRPEAKAIQNLAASKQALADLERRKQYPDLVLVGAATYAYSSSVDNPKNAFFSDPYNTLSAGLAAAVRMPLDLGVKNARAARAQAEADEIAERRAEALSGILFEVRKAHAELVEAQARTKSAAAGERAGRSWITAVTQSFELGLAEMRDFSEALGQYFLARIGYLQAVHDGLLAAAALERATGAKLE